LKVNNEPGVQLGGLLRKLLEQIADAPHYIFGRWKIFLTTTLDTNNPDIFRVITNS
jgi:hypothetical protein